MTPSKASAFYSCLPRAFSTQFHPHLARISVRTFSAFLKTFYYFSLHNQIASYRASLRHGAIGLSSLHFSLDAVHGEKRVSGCAFGYANICNNKDALKQTRAVILQKPTRRGTRRLCCSIRSSKRNAASSWSRTWTICSGIFRRSSHRTQRTFRITTR